MQSLTTFGDGDRARPKCTARTKRTGDRCRQPAIAGGTVCRFHGGNAPQVKGAAARRLIERRIKQIAREENLQWEPLADPIDAILRLASEAWALKAYASAQVEALEEIRYKGHAGEQLRAEVAFYERCIERCHKIGTDIARLDLADRLVRLKEDQAVLVYTAIQRIMDQLELSPQQRVIAGEVIPTELRALEAPKD